MNELTNALHMSNTFSMKCEKERIENDSNYASRQDSMMKTNH